MRNRILELAVGMFLLAGLGGLLVLAFKVSGLQIADAGHYKVYAHFENASGLTARSRVSLSGVTIGQVSAIEVDPDALQALVTLEIYNDVNYLSSDSSASILTAGLLGEKYIGISVGADDELLQDGSFIDDTQSSLVLEELIGKFLFNKVGE